MAAAELMDKALDAGRLRIASGCSAAQAPLGDCRGALRRRRSRPRAEPLEDELVPDDQQVRNERRSSGASARSSSKERTPGSASSTSSARLRKPGTTTSYVRRILESLVLSGGQAAGLSSGAEVRTAGRRHLPSALVTSRRWPARWPSSATSSSCAMRASTPTSSSGPWRSRTSSTGSSSIMARPRGTRACSYDGGFFDRARPLLELLCERGRASGDAAVNMPALPARQHRVRDPASGRALKHMHGSRTTSRSRPGERLPNHGGCTRSPGSRLAAEIRNSPESTLNRRS